MSAVCMPVGGVGVTLRVMYRCACEVDEVNSMDDGVFHTDTCMCSNTSTHIYMRMQ